ncbi:UNVERIFIED_CONTAM: hypothetical protein Sindi_0737000 [Sesamum indicum]
MYEYSLHPQFTEKKAYFLHKLALIVDFEPNSKLVLVLEVLHRRPLLILPLWVLRPPTQMFRQPRGPLLSKLVVKRHNQGVFVSRLRNSFYQCKDLAETSRKRKSRGKSPLRPNSIRSRSQSGEGGLPSEEIRLEEERDMTMLRSYHRMLEDCPVRSTWSRPSPELNWKVKNGFRIGRSLLEVLSLKPDQVKILGNCMMRAASPSTKLLFTYPLHQNGRALCPFPSSEKAAAIGEKRGFEVGHAAGKIAGAIEGRESFLKSEEFTQQIREARLNGVRDFLKTSTFDTAMEIKAAEIDVSFKVTLLHGFAPGFDVFSSQSLPRCQPSTSTR